MRLASSLTAGLTAVTVLLGAAPAGADEPVEDPQVEALYAGSPWFRPGLPYDQNFPDPGILVDGGRTIAYGTSTGGVYLPAMTSTDLVTWTARPPYVPPPTPTAAFDLQFNDALVTLPSWANLMDAGHGNLRTEVWAPGVVRLGDRFLAYLTVQDEPAGPGRPTRHCITVATATDPLGPFVDASGAAPVVCDADPAGSIDADPFVDADGAVYLLWKAEGLPRQAPPRIMAQRLDPSGLAVAAGSSPVELLRPSLWWHGRVVENPSMIRLGERYLLVYSANDWRSRSYALGVAECDGPLGPCTPQGGWPVLGSRDGVLGPGGADAFVGADGVPRIAFHAWADPFVGYPDEATCLPAGTCTSQGQRRLHVAALTVDAEGRIGVGGDAGVTTGYTAEEAASVQWAAAELLVDPEYLQRFGVHATAFLLHLAGRSAVREPLAEPPAVDGEVPAYSVWAAADRPVLDWVADHFDLTTAQAQKAGAALMVFLTGLRAGG